MKSAKKKVRAALHSTSLSMWLNNGSCGMTRTSTTLTSEDVKAPLCIGIETQTAPTPPTLNKHVLKSKVKSLKERMSRKRLNVSEIKQLKKFNEVNVKAMRSAKATFVGACRAKGRLGAVHRILTISTCGQATQLLLVTETFN